MRKEKKLTEREKVEEINSLMVKRKNTRNLWQNKNQIQEKKYRDYVRNYNRNELVKSIKENTTPNFVKSTNGKWAKDKKINTTRSKWEKIKEPEENIFLQDQYKIFGSENEKEIVRFENAILIDVENKMGKIISGYIKYKSGEKMKLFAIQKKNNLKEKVKVYVKNYDTKALRKDSMIKIENIEVKLEDLIRISMEKNMNMYELTRII